MGRREAPELEEALRGMQPPEMQHLKQPRLDLDYCEAQLLPQFENITFVNIAWGPNLDLATSQPGIASIAIEFTRSFTLQAYA
jgi:hypothetical protein